MNFDTVNTPNTRNDFNGNGNGNEKTPADHYFNISFQGYKLGYLVLDSLPNDILQAFERNPEGASQILLSNLEGRYSKRGKSSKEFDTSMFANI